MHQKKELEAIRHTITGIGWADPQQAAVYIGVSHRDICRMMTADEIPYSRVSAKRRRISYANLDEYMMSLREQEVDTKAILNDLTKDLFS